VILEELVEGGGFGTPGTVDGGRIHARVKSSRFVPVSWGPGRSRERGGDVPAIGAPASPPPVLRPQPQPPIGDRDAETDDQAHTERQQDRDPGPSTRTARRPAISSIWRFAGRETTLP
jgi:hypothetical protein